MPALLILTLTLLLFTIYIGLEYWWRTYNTLQRLLTKAQKQHANIPVIMQKRVDNIHTLSQITDKYHQHEYETLKETILARGYNAEQRITGINAVLERYPELKADTVFISLMDKDSQIETQLNEARLFYNQSAKMYNETVRQFPQNLVANYHGFGELTYLKIIPKSYEPQTIFTT